MKFDGTPRPPAPTRSSGQVAHEQVVAIPTTSRVHAEPPLATFLDGSGAPLLDRLARRFEDFQDYARTAWNHSPATIKWYVCAYQNFRRFLVESARLSGGDPADFLFSVEEWLRWNRRRGLGEIATHTYWRGVQRFFRYLVKVDGIADPFEGLKAPRIPSPVPKARSADECRRILLTARNLPWSSAYGRARAVAMFAVLIYAGLRKTELLRLQYADVDVDRGTILVRNGKGRYGGKDRTAFMPPELRDILRSYLRERRVAKLDGPEFFLSLMTKRGLSPEQLKRITVRVRRASGIPFTLHSLRHSFVTMLLQSGVPIHVAKELAGHTDITTTANYLRVWDEEKAEQIRKLHLG